MPNANPTWHALQTGLRRAVQRVSRFWSNPERVLTTMALVIGVVTGLGAIGFSWLVDTVAELYYAHWAPAIFSGAGGILLLPLLPMSGALLVGLITYYFAPEAQGHGVPEVMDAMARRGGRIRPRVAIAKAVSSALTIGSGGSAGTEGPIIQIGAAIGSGFGQLQRMNLNDMRVLIGCGAAAGLSSIFNAPIAGVLFAVEVLLRDVSQRSFVPIILSAVLSNAVTIAVRGHDDPIFPVPVELVGFKPKPIYHFSIEEFGNFAVLGLVCGLVGVALIRALYFTEDVFARLRVHRILKPIIGAALLGVLVLFTQPYFAHTPANAEGHPPAVMGYGYGVVEQTLENQPYLPADGRPSWTFIALVLLTGAKLLATCFTLGSGGSGGVFAPSLFLGATAGGAFGLLIEGTGWFGNADPGSYALVGMAALVAATMHAPLTATLMLFELTQDYKVIIPIMIASVVGIAVASRLESASIYTLQLLRKGIRLGSGDLRLLQRISVREIPRIAAPRVSPDDAMDKLVRVMRTTSANDFVVVDSQSRLVGMVLGDDVRVMLLETDAMPLLTVSDVMRQDIPTVQLDETLDVVLNKFAGAPMQSLPVVDPAHPRDVRELVTRAAVMNRYHQRLAAT